MKISLRQILIKSFLPALSAIILVGGIAYAVWTEPTTAPPGNNADAPVNVGPALQYKSGAFGIGGLLHGYANAIFDGNVGIGTASPSQKLDVAGYVKGQSGLCIGTDCRTAWPSGTAPAPAPTPPPPPPCECNGYPCGSGYTVQCPCFYLPGPTYICINGTWVITSPGQCSQCAI